MNTLEMFSSIRGPRSEGESQNFTPYRYKGPTGSVFGDLMSPEVFIIHFLPKTPEEEEKESQMQMIQRAPVEAIGAAIASRLIFAIQAHRKPTGENEFSKKVIYQEKGAKDMLDFIERIKTESRYEQLREIKGVTDTRMASYAINALGFDIQRDYYGQDVTVEDVLKQSREAEASLSALYTQAGKMKNKKERKAFLKEHNAGILFMQGAVRINISKDELLAKEQTVRSLHDRLVAHRERKHAKGRRGNTFDNLDNKKNIGLFI